MSAQVNHHSTGEAAAAVLAAGFGCFLFGLVTVLAESIPSVKSGLQWVDAVGPLSGKVGVTIIGWVMIWVILHFLWVNKSGMGKKAFSLSLILIALGMLLTFPPVFSMFR